MKTRNSDRTNSDADIIIRPPTQELDYHGVCECSDDIGRSFYDFIPQENGLRVTLGDLLMLEGVPSIRFPCLRPLLRGLTVRHCGDIGEVVRHLNRANRLTGGQDCCASLFYACVDTRRQLLHYVNAGFRPPLLIRRRGGTVQRLKPTGAALGVYNRSVYRCAATTIEPGDVLIATSGGDETGGRLSDRRVLELVFRNPAARASELTWRILGAMKVPAGKSGAGQDRTVVVVRYVGRRAEPAPRENLAEVVTAAA